MGDFAKKTCYKKPLFSQLIMKTSDSVLLWGHFKAMEKMTENSLEIVRVSRADITEYFIHGQISPQSTPIDIVVEAFEYLKENAISAVAFRIFADDTTRQQITADFQTALNGLNCAVTWICQPQGYFAIQVQAISLPVTPIRDQDAVVGCTFEDDNLVSHQLSFVPDDPDAERFDQATNAFEKMHAILEGVGLDFSNTVRTWLFTHDILDWYNKLNLARDEFFNKYDIFNKLVPASTGVGVINPAGAALATENFAVKAKSDNVTIEKVISPMQCPAWDYKSSFARATLVTAPDHRRMLVSGTASIEPGGKTVFQDDVEKQIELSMRVATALIDNAGMDWSDIARGIMYFKDPVNFKFFDDWCITNNVRVPHIKVVADICRDDLLFELEIDGLTV